MGNIKIFGKTKIEGKTFLKTTPVPLTISGLQLWLNAADSSTFFDATAGGSLVTTDGAAVARWADKSGNNRHATQTTANARPIFNTSPSSLRFQTNDFLSLSSSHDIFSNNFDVNIWHRATSVTGGWKVLFETNTYRAGGGDGISIYQNNNAYEIWTKTAAGTATLIINATNKVMNNTWRLLTLKRSSNVMSLRLNNQQIGSSVTNSTNFVGGLYNLGGGRTTYFFDGNIGDVLAYSSSLTEQQSNLIYQTTKNKYGL
jgi:hypothetical protein